MQTVGTAVLRESTVRDGLLQLDGVVNVGVLVDVTLRAGPFDGQSPLRGDLVEGLLSTLVVVLAVQVVVAVTLTHVLDAVVASGAGLGLVDVTLRAVGGVDRIRLIGGTNELPLPILIQNVLAALLCPLGRAIVDSLVHDSVAQVADTGGGKRRIGRCLTVNANVRTAGTRPSDTGVLDVGATLAVHDRRRQSVEGLVVNEGEGLTCVTGDQTGQLQV